MPDHADDFILSRQAALRSPATVSLYKRPLSSFHNWLGDRPVTSSTIREFMVFKAVDCNAGGLHAHARALRAYVRSLEAEGISPHVNIVMPAVPDPARPCPSQEDVQDLLRAARRPRDRFLVYLLADTGIRPSEAAALRWKDVDLERGILELPHTKTGAPRCAYFGTNARRALSVWRNRASGDLLLGLTAAGIRESLRRLSVHAGVHVTPHMLRRHFATASLRNGANVIEVQRLPGHSTTAMVSIYARVTGDALQAAHARPSPGDRLMKCADGERPDCWRSRTALRA
jgi:site-specific recombinase XerD